VTLEVILCLATPGHDKLCRKIQKARLGRFHPFQSPAGKLSPTCERGSGSVLEERLLASQTHRGRLLEGARDLWSSRPDSVSLPLHSRLPVQDPQVQL
jgi:hypothetical protein